MCQTLWLGTGLEMIINTWWLLAFIKEWGPSSAPCPPSLLPPDLEPFS